MDPTGPGGALPTCDAIFERRAGDDGDRFMSVEEYEADVTERLLLVAWPALLSATMAEMRRCARV